MNQSIRISKPDPTSWETFNLKHLIPASGGLCLDLGCGLGAKKDLASLGYRYIGVDLLMAPGVNAIANAAALPFFSNQFDLVIAASSFEHFPDPWTAAREVKRILKPGGCIVASLAFLEPYHAKSYFHMTHLGVKRLFTESGLVIEAVEPFEWTGPEAIAQALFQLKLFRYITAGCVTPILWARRLIIRIFITLLSDQSRKNRGKEFLEEERFRFAAGIKVRARCSEKKE